MYSTLRSSLILLVMIQLLNLVVLHYRTACANPKAHCLVDYMTTYALA